MIPSLIGDAAKLTTLKNAIVADGTLNAFPNNEDGNEVIAAAFNAAAAPDFWAFKRVPVSLRDVGDNLNGSELAGLTSLNHTRLQTVVALSAAGVDPSKADRRQFFDDIFNGAGGATTRANLAALWRRLVTRAERLYATGTGTTGDPGAMTNHGALTRGEVESARRLL